jgi:hypothetical protein
MPLRKAEITRHAWFRFKSRWGAEHPNDYTEEIRKLLAEAEEEDLGHAAAVRIITNGFKPARYFRSGDWRFVLNEELTTIMTIERAYYQKWHPVKKEKRNRKQRI